MKKFTQNEAEAFIIKYMISHHYIGHRQTTFDNMVRYVPASDKKVVIKALEELRRQGFLTSKRKHYGVHISLIPEKLEEIRNYLSRLEPQDR